MSLFSNFIDQAKFMDLPLTSGKFTWCNNLDPHAFCRLNRFLISFEFLVAWLNLVQNLLPRSLSDHNSMCLSVEEIYWGPKPFRFFNHWLDMDGFHDLIIFAWNSASSR
ncbi:hypothetical protein REPUB_Repub16aG0005200 [Reevesia pubescens]